MILLRDRQEPSSPFIILGISPGAYPLQGLRRHVVRVMNAFIRGRIPDFPLTPPPNYDRPAFVIVGGGQLMVLLK